jgi:hypothetical protein
MQKPTETYRNLLGIAARGRGTPSAGDQPKMPEMPKFKKASENVHRTLAGLACRK